MLLRVISGNWRRGTGDRDQRPENEENENNSSLFSDFCPLSADFDDLWIDIGGEG